jgi:hypothetical protein
VQDTVAPAPFSGYSPASNSSQNRVGYAKGKFFCHIIASWPYKPKPTGLAPRRALTNQPASCKRH